MALLDDPFSAVDGPTGERMFHCGVKSTLDGVTRIITLNSHLHLLPQFDRVLVIEAGRIVADGSAAELRGVLARFVTQDSQSEDTTSDKQNFEGNDDSTTSNKPTTVNTRRSPSPINEDNVDGRNNGDGTEDGVDSASDRTVDPVGTVRSGHDSITDRPCDDGNNDVQSTVHSFQGGVDSPTHVNAAGTNVDSIAVIDAGSVDTGTNNADAHDEHQVAMVKKGKLIRAESRKRGAVSASVYRQYFGAAVESNSRAVGIAILFAVVLLFGAGQALRMLSDAWLVIWVKRGSSQSSSDGYVYIGLLVIAIVVQIARVTSLMTVHFTNAHNPSMCV